MISKASPDWQSLKQWLLEQIELSRQRLESPDCRAIAEADQLRGRIAAYRGIIATVEPVVVPLAIPIPYS